MSHSGDLTSSLWVGLIKLIALGSVWLTAGLAQADEVGYQIQPGDVLHVSVWKETDLQAELLVRPDGGISFPLAGDLIVSGLSVAQVSDAIAERIKRYVPDPVVTAEIKAIGGNRIYVVGKVNKPGEFTFNRQLDVMQVLSLAGGGTAFASLSDIRILRRENGKQIALRFDYTDLEKGKALDKNILLKSGDTVVVP
ncbi:MAG: polysaccharide biosynthesis/export family protein [Steroidobacteraceae bacterium]